MGWGLKIGLFLFALAAATFDAWIVTIPLLLILFLPAILGHRGKKSRNRKAPADGGRVLSLPNLLGASLVLLSVVAFYTGGVLSPIILLVAGLSLLLRRRIPSPVSTGLTPVQNSILLRHKLAPFRWSALAEAKISARELEGALSGVNQRLLYVSNPAPRIFLVFSESSFRRTRAERRLVAQVQGVARALTPLGVYLLPLDSNEAAQVVGTRCAEVQSDGNLSHFISAGEYGAVAVEAEQGFVERLEFYARADEAQKTRLGISGIKERNAGQLTLRELLHGVRQRLGSPRPDGYAAFLSSMAATAGEVIGQRIIESEQGRNRRLLLVASLGGPKVELSRAQLRAINGIYE